MPELPHVQVFKEYADATSLHKRIEDVRVQDDRPLEGVSIARLKKTLRGRSFGSSRRHGKWLFLATDDGPVLGLHFGMTGRLVHTMDAKAPAGTVFSLRFADGSTLAMVMPRMLGKVVLTEDPDAFLEARDVGPDALDMEEERFVRRVRTRSGMVKTALMDQGVLAGLGNEMVDEALFMTGLHPRTKVEGLSDTDIVAIRRAAQEATEMIVKARARRERLPERMLLRHRGEKNAKCPRCHVPFDRTKVGGRTTYVCPRHQPATGT